jgi:type I restriction enzyme S subunit
MREGWKEVVLGDVLFKIVGGGTPSKAIDSYWNGDVYWCSVKDMTEESKYLYSTEDTITFEGLKNSSSNLIKRGTVVTATRMGLGRAFISGVDMAINQDLKALYPNEKIDNIFLLYTILFNKDVIEALGSGATVKGIKLETLKSIKFLLPPLETQRKIAKILSNYDDLIENNLKRIKILEEMAQQTYEEWFVRMRFPGYETATINETTGLPEGWERDLVGNQLDITSTGVNKF